MPLIGHDINLAVRNLRAGCLVAFPTETVYGLGGDAANQRSVAAIYHLKNRPTAHPLIIHLPDFSDADDWAQDIPPLARRLAQKFMPGPLTLILPRHRQAPSYDSANERIALRVPAHTVARKLLAAFAAGIAAPSANRFGRLSPTSAAHVMAEFPKARDLYVLDGGDCTVGIESAIVDCQEDVLFLLRPGTIGEEALSEAAGKKLLPPPATACAPGLLQNHYVPLIPLVLVTPETVTTASPQTAVLSRQRPAAVAAKYWRLATDDPVRYARKLYRLLRELETTGATMIWVETPPTSAPWQAIHNRLYCASIKKGVV